MVNDKMTIWKKPRDFYNDEIEEEEDFYKPKLKKAIFYCDFCQNVCLSQIKISPSDFEKFKKCRCLDKFNGGDT